MSKIAAENFQRWSLSQKQLAEAQARINELTTMCEDLVCEAKDFAYKLEQKTVQLVEAQAREAELVAHVERLREALYKCQLFKLNPNNVQEVVNAALAATPEQSLARIRNQVREECAKVCDRFAEREMHPAECAAALRAMKEPE